MKRTTAALLLFLAARLAAAQPVTPNGRTAAPAGKQRLIVVWKPGSGSEADIGGLGGTVESREAGRVVITVPDQAAVVEALRHNPHVQYIQRSVFAEEITNPNGAAATTPAFRTDEVVVSDAAKHLTPRTDATILWSTGAYQYDGAGNIMWIGTVNVPNSDSRSHAYAYDRVGRLVSGTGNGWDPVTGATQDWTQTYVYDRYGNMTSMTTMSPTSTVTSPIAVSTTTNRLNTAGVTFDAVGNQTYDPGTLAQMEYDSLNMMTMKYPGVYNNQDYYIYDSDDQRIGIHQGLKWTWSLRDEGGALLRQYTCNGQATGPTLNDCLWLEDYVYRGDQLLAAERVPEQGGRRHFHLDHLGTPRLITGANGSLISRHEYLPFGREMTPISTELNPSGYDRIDPPHFTGHERDFGSTVGDSTDATDYMHARYYSQNVARFYGVDPTWSSSDIGRPQSWNRYSYVLNNPVRYTDPDGRCTDVMSCVLLGARMGTAISGPGTVIGIVAGLTLGYGITHPAQVAAFGNSAGGGDSAAIDRHVRSVSNQLMKEEEKAELPELPARDKTGKIHTNEDGLPTAEELQKYPTEDLQHFQEELKGSVGERIKSTSSLPDQTKDQRVKHGDRQAEEQRLIKTIDRIIEDRGENE